MIWRESHHLSNPSLGTSSCFNSNVKSVKVRDAVDVVGILVLLMMLIGWDLKLVLMVTFK